MPPAAKKSSPTKLNTAKSKAPTARPGDTTPKGTPRKTAKSKGTGKVGKDKLQGIEEEISAAPAAAQKAAEKAGPTTVFIGDKKIEYLSKELLSRQPLDEKARKALLKKCGEAKQEVNFERNENRRPIGRADGLTPSRHERVPPMHIVLMFNCFEASFTLAAGDLTTLPESDTLDLRSLTSGKVLGRIKITPEKGKSAACPRPIPFSSLSKKQLAEHVSRDIALMSAFCFEPSQALPSRTVSSSQTTGRLAASTVWRMMDCSPMGLLSCASTGKH